MASVGVTSSLPNKVVQSDDAGAIWKIKSDQMKKTEVMRELDQTKNKILAAERDRNGHVFNRRSEFRQLFCGLDEQDAKFTSTRKEEGIRIRQDLDRMKNMVIKFHTDLTNIKPSPDFVEKLKITIEDIEEAINGFKGAQRTIYEELMRDEHVIYQEILTCQNRIDAWSNVPPGAEAAPVKPGKMKPPPSTSARDISANLPPEVAEFEKFVQQTGGMRGGWDEYDHETFLKIRNRFKGKSSFLGAAVSELPGRSVDGCRDHETWYQQLLEFTDKKKEAIQNWKQQKETQKLKMLSEVEHNEKRKVELEVTKAEIRAMSLERDKHDKITRLRAWKEEKEFVQRKEAEDKLSSEKGQRKRLQIQQLQREQQKLYLEEYRSQRKEEEEFLHLEEEARKMVETERRQREAEEEIVRFQERDRLKMFEKKVNQKLRENETEERKKRLEKLKQQVEVQVDRDPTRLYKMTEGWKNRLREANTDSSTQPVVKIPHRAIPAWRQMNS